MAKPIQPTSNLSGNEADEFIKKMIETENREPTEFEKTMAIEIRKNRKHFVIGENIENGNI